MTRFVLYALGFLASIATMAGFGTYQDGVFDLHPFNVSEAALSIVTLLSSGTAMWAWWTGKIGRDK